MLRVIREVRPRWVVGENVFGIVNWSGGLVFDEVQADLEAAGYEVQAYVLPAASVGAPHRRDRVWFVAHTDQQRLQRSHIFTESERFKSQAWDNWPTTEPTICRGDDGVSSRLDGITFSKWRNESIKAYGNAVAPQVVYQIFRTINDYENSVF